MKYTMIIKTEEGTKVVKDLVLGRVMRMVETYSRVKVLYAVYEQLDNGKQKWIKMS